jgi:hypothetical protein
MRDVVNRKVREQVASATQSKASMQKDTIPECERARAFELHPKTAKWPDIP